MADPIDEGPGGYRRPPAGDPPGEARGSAGPRQPLGAWRLGPLGALKAELDLGDALELRVDRRRVQVIAGGGLHLRGAAGPLPPITIRRADADLGTLALDLDADGLGPGIGVAASIAAIELLRALELRPRPGQTLADRWLAGRASDRQGRRQMAALPKARASAWLEPETELHLRLDRRALEVSLSRALAVAVLGVGLGIAAFRYVFAARRVELVRGGRGLAGVLGLLLLPLVAFVATRWLRRRLPAPLTSPGYDPWDDDARALHLKAVLAALRPPSAAEEASPKIAWPSAQSLLGGLQAASPGPETWLLARLPIAEGGTIGLGLRRGASLHAELSALSLRVRAEGGLFVHADERPELARLRLVELRARLDAESVAIDAEPPLGEAPRALVQELLRRIWIPQMPPALRRLVGVEPSAERRVLWRHDLGEGRSITVALPPAALLEARHGEALTELRATPGILVDVAGAAIPSAILHRLSYDWRDGAIEVETQPALGPLENSLITHFVRHRLADRLPAALGLHGPKASPAIDQAAIARRPHTIFETTAPQIGRVRARIDPADTLSLAIGPQSRRLVSAGGILLVADDLGLTFEITEVSIDASGEIEVEAAPAPGAYLGLLLGGLFRTFVDPLVRRFVPPPPPDDAPWILGAWAHDAIGEVQLALAPGDLLEVIRSGERVTIQASEGLQLRASDERLPPVVLEAMSWDPKSDQIAIRSAPALGPLTDQALSRVLRRALGPWLARARAILALPDHVPAPPPPPPIPGPSLFHGALPALGGLEVALPRTYFGLLELDAEGRARLTIDGGLRLRLRDLPLRVALEELELRADPFDLEITCEPAIGPLERQLVVRLLEAQLAPLRGVLWPADGIAPDGHRPLATLPLSPAIGPLRLSLPAGAVLRLALDRQMLELGCEAGVHVRLDGAPWLPDVHLHKLTYTLADGAIDLRFSGVVERYYHEQESVSLITEAILAHILRVLLSPKLPAWLLPLGFQRFELPPPPAPRPDRIVLFRLPLAADMGEATVAMEPDETILVTASPDEIQLRCDRGLWIALPALRFGLHARTARYHPRSGEVQVGGLGQLENAVIEAIIREHLGGGGEGAPIGALVDRLPVDAKGRRTLFARGPVSVAMKPGTRFTLAFSASGIDFTADPPLVVDGPGVLDYQLRGLHYAFARAAFSLVLADDGVVASLFTGVVAETAESQLGELLRPLLPPAMREPGYALARDPRSAESLAAVVAAFSGRRKAT